MNRTRYMNRIDRRWLLGIPLGMLITMGVASSTPNYPVVPKFPAAQITNANTTTAVTFFTGASAVTKVVGMFCTSNDTTLAHNITIQRFRTNTYWITTVQVPISAGTVSGVPPVNVMSQILGLPGGGEPYFYVESTDTIQIQSDTTVTSGKFVTCSAVTADFT